MWGMLYSVSVKHEYGTVIVYKYTRDTQTAQCVNRIYAYADLTIPTTAILIHMEVVAVACLNRFMPSTAVNCMAW
jgi:hypothetical protein